MRLWRACRASSVVRAALEAAIEALPPLASAAASSWAKDGSADASRRRTRLTTGGSSGPAVVAPPTPSAGALLDPRTESVEACAAALVGLSSWPLAGSPGSGGCCALAEAPASGVAGAACSCAPPAASAALPPAGELRAEKARVRCWCACWLPHRPLHVAASPAPAARLVLACAPECLRSASAQGSRRAALPAPELAVPAASKAALNALGLCRCDAAR